MTPTEQDKELREKIQKVVATYLRFYGDIQRDSATCASELMQLITADRKRVVLEARLDELKTIRDNYETQNTVKFGTVIKWSDINDRIAELKAQQEEA